MQDGQLMLKGNKLKLQRGAAAKTEGEDRNNSGENQYHAVTVRLVRENLQLSQACWKFEQRQDFLRLGSLGSIAPLGQFCAAASLPARAASESAIFGLTQRNKTEPFAVGTRVTSRPPAQSR